MTTAISNQCGQGMVSQTCRQPSGQVEIIANDWYCTNRPNVSTPLNIALPFSGAGAPSITRAEVNFQTSSLYKSIYSHTSAISMNGVQLGYSTIDDQTRTHTFSVPPAALTGFQGGVSTNSLNLQSVHDNSAHYSVGSEFSLTVGYDSFLSQQCVPDGLVSVSGFMNTQLPVCQQNPIVLPPDEEEDEESDDCLWSDGLEVA